MMYDFYKENYKIMIKYIKEDLKNWTNIPCSWTILFKSMKILTIKKLIHKCINYHSEY